MSRFRNLLVRADFVTRDKFGALQIYMQKAFSLVDQPLLDTNLCIYFMYIFCQVMVVIFFSQNSDYMNDWECIHDLQDGAPHATHPNSVQKYYRARRSRSISNSNGGSNLPINSLTEQISDLEQGIRIMIFVVGGLVHVKWWIESPF